jgi:hypothetical protein
MSELKPCPHCETAWGDDGPMLIKPGCDEVQQYRNTDYFVECTECDMRGPSCDGPMAAREAWDELPRQSDLDALRARIAELDPPWHELDDTSALPNFEVEVAFENGTTRFCTDMDCDESGWFARDCVGRAIHSSGKRLAVTHWRPHVAPKHPEAE